MKRSDVNFAIFYLIVYTFYFNGRRLKNVEEDWTLVLI